MSVREADQTLQPNRSSTRALATRPWKRAGRPGPAGDDPRAVIDERLAKVLAAQAGGRVDEGD